MAKTKESLSTSERNDILRKIVDFSKTKATEGYHYSYAFGYISVILTDKQLKNLEKGLQ